MFGRNKIAALVAEFLGTFSLASVVLAMAARTSFPFFVAAAAGSTLGLMVLLVGSVSGAHLNPAVTIGMWTLRKIETTRAVVFIAIQMLGGVVAWRFNEYLLDTSLKNIANAHTDWRVFTAEAVGTFIFTFGIAAVLYQGYKGLRQAAGIGGSLALGMVVASFGSNAALNPAVAVGIHSWSFIYVTAPILGSLVGMNVYVLLFAPQAPQIRAALSSATSRLSRSSRVTTTQKRPAKKPAHKTKR